MADLTFDMDAVTPRMLVDFKAKTGQNLLAVVGEDVNLEEADPEVITGFIWLALRMGPKPDASWDDALDTPFTALNLDGEGEAPDPTTASSTPS